MEEEPAEETEQRWTGREQEIRRARAKEVEWPSGCDTAEGPAEKAPSRSGTTLARATKEGGEAAGVGRRGNER